MTGAAKRQTAAPTSPSAAANPAAPCTALLTADDGWQCEKCALAWDEGDKSRTYARLRAACEDEAERIAQSLRAILEIRPAQKFRNQRQLRKRMEFLALAKLIDRLKLSEPKR